MLVEIKLFTDTYNRKLTKEQFEIIKTHFYPDIRYKAPDIWYVEQSIERHHKETAPEDWKSYNEGNTDEKPKSSEWFKEMYKDPDDRDRILSDLNMSLEKPHVECTDNIVVDLDLWNEHWKWPYSVVRTVNVKEKYKNEGEVISHLKHILNTVDEKLINLNHISEKVSQMTFNQKCDVHMGGGFLMRVNRLQLLEDACTDGLQEELNKGWRIIAVTVQPDQRRPDYILGMYDEGYEHDASSAQRKN